MNLSLNEKLELADDHNTAPEVLRELSGDTSTNIRCLVASNRNTPVDVFTVLVDDNDLVRYHIARNPCAPKEVLSKLAENKDIIVRRVVSSNKNTSLDSLMRLANDSDIFVVCLAERNPNATEDVIMLAKATSFILSFKT
jgi:hypothetical protein